MTRAGALPEAGRPQALRTGRRMPLLRLRLLHLRLLHLVPAARQAS